MLSRLTNNSLTLATPLFSIINIHLDIHVTIYKPNSQGVEHNIPIDRRLVKRKTSSCVRLVYAYSFRGNIFSRYYRTTHLYCFLASNIQSSLIYSYIEEDYA